MSGTFVISLDFELIWGLRDKWSISQYGKNILGGRTAIPRLLELFLENEIHCTWASVGCLFARNKSELNFFLPTRKPEYFNQKVSSYTYMNEVLENENSDPYHFANSLLEKIRTYPGQEIASHTFSHYYCREKGQTIKDFEMDLKCAADIANKYDVALKSLVFPRNQLNNEYLYKLKEIGFTSYRGNPRSLIHRENISGIFLLLQRALRLLDSYINLFGHQTYTLGVCDNNGLFDIPQSRFLRPYSSKFKFAESLKMNRIFKDMEYAAKNEQIYHLWWHPHNFGINIDENINQLKEILNKYKELKKTYNFKSCNMYEVSTRGDVCLNVPISMV